MALNMLEQFNLWCDIAGRDKEAALNELKEELLRTEQAPVKSSKSEPVQTMTRKEAAEFLKVTPVTLDRYRKAGLVQGHQLRGRVVYYYGELLAKLNGKKPVEVPLAQA